MLGINKLILGDNLEIMRKMDSETIDLIYLDPPFFSNRNYEVLWGDEGEIRSFIDRWSGGVDHYVMWLKERVAEMHRLLKKTGSIFLHCDWHANSYIRVEILDKIFGYQNFKGEIVWQRHNAHNDAKKKLAVLKDTIWYYSKSDNFIYNPIFTELTEKYKDDFYRYSDDNGIYRLSDLTGAGINQNDLEWRNYHPAKRNRHWAIPTKPIDEIAGKEQSKNLTTIEKLEILYSANLIEISKNNVPSFKRYLDTSNGALVGDVWTDIKNVQSQSSEKIGYPTQKPELLLKRIIEMSSNVNQTVLDPFVGGGTTVVVADRLNRNWIGIDQSVQAVKVTEFRLNVLQGKVLNSTPDMFAKPFTTQLHKYDYYELKNRNPMLFESWIIEQFNGIPNTKQKGDLGIDGKTRENIPIQVKQSENIGRNVVDNFNSAIKRYDKSLYDKNIQENKIAGFIIAFSFGKGAIQEVARLQNQENVIIKLVRVDEIVPISTKPTINVNINDLGINTKKLREIEFLATGLTTENKKIEFFAWDFNYNGDYFKAEVLRDKEGKQTKHFAIGEHKIAVKVIDSEGLENMDIIKLRINGKITIN